jgi:hypothetical protein
MTKINLVFVLSEDSSYFNVYDSNHPNIVVAKVFDDINNPDITVIEMKDTKLSVSKPFYKVDNNHTYFEEIIQGELSKQFTLYEFVFTQTSNELLPSYDVYEKNDPNRIVATVRRDTSPDREIVEIENKMYHIGIPVNPFYIEHRRKYLEMFIQIELTKIRTVKDFIDEK